MKLTKQATHGQEVENSAPTPVNPTDIVRLQDIAGKRLANVASDLTTQEKDAFKGKLDLEFSATLNQHGAHPAFNSQNEAIVWLLSNAGVAPTLAVSNITSDSIDYQITE